MVGCASNLLITSLPPSLRPGNNENLISNPSMLPAFIARNAELAAASKDARVTTDVNKNNLTMAAIVRAQSKNLSSLAPMAPEAFMKALMTQFRAAEGIDWLQFGRESSVYFREPPTAHGLYHM